MKVSDCIVEFLIEKGITDIFGYPGGMVTHLMDSFSKYSERIHAHVTYHEQGAAFAACGYAQTSGKVGVAYATSGPGATNLLTGVCNAYFDSIPTLFITGQVNTFEGKGDLAVRQRGFQETDIVAMAKPVTKLAVKIDDANNIRYFLEKAFSTALSGRKGPVLLDIPMNVFRTEIDPLTLKIFACREECKSLDKSTITELLRETIGSCKRPVILFGAGVKDIELRKHIHSVLNKLQIPAITSMIGFDVIGDYKWNMGFIGAYGHRTANFVVAKADLIIVIGSRMDIRQVGFNRKNFAPNAKILRFDIDAGELEYCVHEDEEHIVADAGNILEILEDVDLSTDFNEWRNVCRILKEKLGNLDKQEANTIVGQISKKIPDEVVVTTDVGQNQVWVAQSFLLKNSQQILFSGGHGAMGYSLPAAIGAYYGSNGKSVFCFTGDGGLQMNIQELQFIVREQLPIKIIVLNNSALGMIRHFQEMYFEKNYFQTKKEGGYTVPDFSAIANAYGIEAKTVRNINEVKFDNLKPQLFNVILNGDTYVFPKLEFGKPNQDQEPLIERDLYDELMAL